MIKGQPIQEKDAYMAAESLFEITNGGWDIYQQYIKIKREEVILSPIREDKNPSFSVFYNGKVWLWKDLSRGDSGNAIHMVMEMFHLDFADAIRKIVKDMGKKMNYNPPPKINEVDTLIAFSDKKWSKEHWAFWENTEVTQDWCLKYDTFAVKQAAINRVKIPIHDGEVVWAYYAADIDKVKLYFPEREKSKRFKNNIPGNYLWNMKNIQSCEKLMIQKSMKDLIVNTLLMPCTTATQHEAAGIFTEEIVGRLEGLAEEIFVSYGSDAQGVEQSTILTKEHDWKWVNPEAHLLPTINDVYSLTKKYGLKEWEKMLKLKKVIL